MVEACPRDQTKKYTTSIEIRKENKALFLSLSVLGFVHMKESLTVDFSQYAVLVACEKIDIQNGYKALTLTMDCPLSLIDLRLFPVFCHNRPKKHTHYGQSLSVTPVCGHRRRSCLG